MARHRNLALIILSATILAGCEAQPDMVLPAPSVNVEAPVVEVSQASDEFDDPSTLAEWSVMHGELPDGTPSRFDIGQTTPGALTVVPSRSWWVNTTQGFFLYKRVHGDFTVTVRIRASGHATPVPTLDWSLAGLLLRAPEATTPSEQWIGYTVGFVGAPRVERKTTRSGRSELRLIPVAPGWIELRAVRTGALILLLRRQDGQEWSLDAVYHRPDLPETLQVGIDAQSGYESDHTDLVAETDWIHFTDTGIPAGATDDLLGRISRAVSREDGNTLTANDTATVREALLRYATVP
jgi:hypothetical protein